MQFPPFARVAMLRAARRFNSQVACSNFLAQGALQVLPPIDPKPGANHTDCAIPALEAAKAWFDTFKQ